VFKLSFIFLDQLTGSKQVLIQKTNASVWKILDDTVK